MENTEENCEMIGKIWRNPSWRVKSLENTEEIVKRYEKYGRKVGWIVKWYGIYGRKVGWIVKRHGKYGRNSSRIVKRFGKYGRKLWNNMENMEENIE